MFNRPDAQGGNAGGFFAGAQVFRLVQLIVETVQHEIQKIRNHCLRALALQKFYQMIVAGGREFYQDLTDDADPGLFDVQDGNGVKIPDDIPAEAVEFS